MTKTFLDYALWRSAYLDRHEHINGDPLGRVLRALQTSTDPLVREWASGFGDPMGDRLAALREYLAGRGLFAPG